MSPELLEQIVPHVARWVCYTFLVWILIKIQKIQFSAPGLLLATAAAEVTTLIPVAGGYASYAVLLLFLWKSTRADLVPDIVFTVAVSSALMFCVNLWIIGMLMGQLGYAVPQEVVADASELEPGAEPEWLIPEEPGMKESTVVELPSGDSDVVTYIKSHPSGLTLKGIGYSTRRPLAMLSVGGPVESKAPGDGFSFDTKQGSVIVKVLEVQRNYVLLELDGSQKVKLLLE